MGRQIQSLATLLVAIGLCVSAGTAAYAEDNATAPTYSNEIARIFQTTCVECHRVGEIGPMPLTSYDEVRPWAKSIKEQVNAKLMPPWHADPVAGPYKNDISLPDADINTITSWVDAGAPRGNPKDLPESIEDATGWRNGTPDQILQMPYEVHIPAGGEEIYRCFVMPAAEEDLWVRTVEFHPSNRAVAHHLVLYLDRGGKQSVRLDEMDETPGYPCFGGPGFPSVDFVGVWAPGAMPDRLPDEVAFKLPKGSRLVLQTHYQPIETDETDQSEIGLFFAKGPVRKTFRSAVTTDLMLNIQPGEKNHVSYAHLKFDRPVHIHSVFPHMHLLGQEYTMTAKLPDGTEKILVSVSRYDFNWQRTYFYEEPVALPAGTSVEMKAVYDNSADNPFNPNSPPKTVRFGLATTDEMNVGLLYYTDDAEDLIDHPERVIPAVGFAMPNVDLGDIDLSQIMDQFGGQDADLGALAKQFLGDDVDIEALAKQFLGEDADLEALAKQFLGENGEIDIQKVMKQFGQGNRHGQGGVKPPGHP